jgi:hypothetical protein
MNTKKLIFMKQFVLGLIILLFVSSTVYAQERVTKDYANELCQCLLYHAHKHIHLEHLDYGEDIDEDEDGPDIVTMIMNTCYPIHYLQVRTYAPNDEVAVDMMHDEAVENAYEELAEAAVEFITEGNLN